jgi:hypothetical protein
VNDFEKEEHFTDRNNFTKNFVEFYAPYAVKKYLRIKNAFQEINYFFLNTLLSPYEKEEFKRVMAGFFLAVHESSGWSSHVFDQNTLKGVIELFVENTKENFKDSESWGSPEDPFETSPSTGQSSLSLEEIKRYALKIHKTKEDDMNESDVIIKKTKQFIDIILVSKNGKKEYMKEITYPTLYQKWENMDDTIELIRCMGGKKYQKPDLLKISCPKKKRIVAINTLKYVQSEILSLLDEFKEKSLFFILKKEKGKLSLNDIFSKDYSDEEKEIEKSLCKNFSGVKGFF